LEGFDPKESTDFLMNLSNAMKVSDLIINRSAYQYLTDMDITFVSSNGSDVKQKIVRTAVGISTVASSDKGQQTRSYGDDLSSQFGLDRFNAEHFLKEA